MAITDETNLIFGVFCGQRTGETVLVSGNYTVIRFHSHGGVQKRGFVLFFTAVPIGKSYHNVTEKSYQALG